MIDKLIFGTEVKSPTAGSPLRVDESQLRPYGSAPVSFSQGAAGPTSARSAFGETNAIQPPCSNVLLRGYANESLMLQLQARVIASEAGSVVGSYSQQLPFSFLLFAEWLFRSD